VGSGFHRIPIKPVIGAIAAAILPISGAGEGDLAVALASGDSDGVMASGYQLTHLRIVHVKIALYFFSELVQTRNSRR
jgi:hypothetical protein